MIGQEDEGQEVQGKAPPQFLNISESVGAIVTIPKNRAAFSPRDLMGYQMPKETIHNERAGAPERTLEALTREMGNVAI